MSDHHDTDHPKYQQHHFDSMVQQSQSTLFGIWLFMAQEILFFGGLFGAYTAYRSIYYDAYIAGASTMDVVWGLINTIVLIGSSVTVVFAVKSAREEKRFAVVGWLVATLLLGGVFLGVKTIEYSGKYEHHLIPGDSRLFAKLGVDPKPFDFAHYKEWSEQDRLLGHMDHDTGEVGLPRTIVKDGWMRYSKNTKQREFLGTTRLERRRAELLKVVEDKTEVLDDALEVDTDEQSAEIKTLRKAAKKAKGDEKVTAQAKLEAAQAALVALETTYGSAVEALHDDMTAKLLVTQHELEDEFAAWKAKRAAALDEYQSENAYNPAPYSPDFHEDTTVPKGVELYFSLYFAMTGMHALHMVIGAFLLIWIAILAAKGTFNKEYHPHVEYFGLYWHFVDIVWIFLFPLLYLI